MGNIAIARAEASTQTSGNRSWHHLSRRAVLVALGLMCISCRSTESNSEHSSSGAVTSLCGVLAHEHAVAERLRTAASEQLDSQQVAFELWERGGDPEVEGTGFGTAAERVRAYGQAAAALCRSLELTWWLMQESARAAKKLGADEVAHAANGLGNLSCPVMTFVSPQEASFRDDFDKQLAEAARLEKAAVTACWRHAGVEPAPPVPSPPSVALTTESERSPR